MIDHIWIDGDVECFKEIGETDTIDRFTNPFVLQRILSKEVNAFFGKLIQFLKVFIAFIFSFNWFIFIPLK